MRSNSKVFRSLGMLTLVAAFALVAGGCGGGGNKSSSGGSNGGKTYPLLRVSWDAPDYMDPGLYYTVAAYQADQLRLGRAARLQAHVRALPARSSCRISRRRCPRSLPTA